MSTPSLEDSACVALITQAVIEAREARKQSLIVEFLLHGGNVHELSMLITLNMSRRLISNIPLEVIYLIKDEIERLAAMKWRTRYATVP